MEIITVQNLIKLAKHGHFPLFNIQEVIKCLRRATPLSKEEEVSLREIIRHMKSFKTFERKKLYIQSMKISDKEILIKHLYSQAHLLREKKHTKYN